MIISEGWNDETRGWKEESALWTGWYCDVYVIVKWSK